MTSQHFPHRTRFARLPQAIFAATLLAGAFVVAPPATAQSILVTTTADDQIVNGNCTLREAVIAANTDTAVDACPAGNGADVVVLAGGTYALAVAGAGEDAAATGDLDVTADLTIEGVSLIGTFVSASQLDRVFEVVDGSHLTLTRLTVEDGNGTVGGPGGAIRIENNGTLTLATARVRNTSGGGTQAVYALTGAQVILLSSRIEDNLSGGVYLQTGSTGLIRDSSLSGNVADNGAGVGVGLNSTLTLVNSTVSGNLGQVAGGIAISGVARLYNVTVADNHTSFAVAVSKGGGILVEGTGNVYLANSIVADNINSVSGAPDDCAGVIDSGGYNLIETVTGCTLTGITISNITGVDPLLDVLDNYGGSTLTHRLQTGSPAIDAGYSTGCLDDALAVLLTDQRAFRRNGVCDIGAFEYHSPGAATATTTPTASLTATPSRTATRTATASATPTRTSTGTATASATMTGTAVTPTETLPGVSPTPSQTASATNTSAPCLPGGDRVCTAPTPTATAVPCTTNCLYLPVILDEP